jgi:hypothetical protein
MKTQELEQLLSQPEGPKLDFKRELNIYANNVKAKRHAKNELIKDILSLANGNTSVAGEPGYLIIGADNNLQADGSRQIFDVEDRVPTKSDLLKIVNSACRPPLDRIGCQTVTIDREKVFVIAVPPTPYVHETTRDLKTAKTVYHEHSVFVRHDEDIGFASHEEHMELQAAKAHHFRQRKNVNPFIFGAVNNGFLIGIMSWEQIKDIPDINQGTRVVLLIIVTVIGIISGLMYGYIFKELTVVRNEWRWLPLDKRISLIVAGIILLIGLLIGPLIFSNW